jgi:hypothetical protein
MLALRVQRTCTTGSASVQIGHISYEDRYCRATVHVHVLYLRTSGNTLVDI